MIKHITIGATNEECYFRNCKKKCKVFVTNWAKKTLRGYCKEHFLLTYPEWKKSHSCSNCKDNFNCNIQEILMSKKELRYIKKELLKLPELK